MRSGIRKSRGARVVWSVLTATIAALSAAVLGVPSIAIAEYPQKPVSFIVQWAPSQLDDVLTRMIAEDFRDTYGNLAAVVNKSGSGPSVVDVVANPADGYTVGSFVVGLPIDDFDVGIIGLVPETFEPLGIFMTHPFVLVASQDVPYSNITAMTNYASENKVVFGHAGESLPPTKSVIAFAKNAGFEWGGEIEVAKADCDTLAKGEADIISTTLQRIKPCLDDVKVLASITEGRNLQLPDTPTLGEIDPTLVLGFWNGLFVHKDTPTDIRDKIIDVVKTTVDSERAQTLVKDTGAIVYWQDAEQAAQRIVVDRGTLVEINKIIQ